MKAWPLLILAVLSVSCMTQKRVYRYLEKHPLESTSDTMVETHHYDTLIEYRDTTIYINLPGEVREDSVRVDTGQGDIAPPESPGWPYVEYSGPPVPPAPDTATVKTSLATAKAWMDPRGYLHVHIEQHDTTLTVELDSALAREQYWHNQYLEVNKTQTVPEKFIPVIYRVALWSWVGVIIIFLILLLLKRLRI